MNIPVVNCSSCGACANICARGAISMRLDLEGFYRPVIDAEKCVQCGACEKVCPWTNAVSNPNFASDAPQTVAVFAKDEYAQHQQSEDRTEDNRFFIHFLFSSPAGTELTALFISSTLVLSAILTMKVCSLTVTTSP